MEHLDIIVKDACGAYTTNTYKGTRSSSTSSAKAAAELQGSKLFGERFVSAGLLHDIGAGTQTWRLAYRKEGA